MKKPSEKKSPPKKDEGMKVSNQVIGKALEFGKELASTGNNLIDWGKEVQRTKAVAINADAQVAVAKEDTAKARLDAATEITRIHANHHKDKMDQELGMARLQIERENMVVLNRQRERVLDKILEDHENKVQLVDSYRALLGVDKKL